MARASQEPVADPAHAKVCADQTLRTREGPAWGLGEGPRAWPQLSGLLHSLPRPPHSGLAGGPPQAGQSAAPGFGQLSPVCKGVLASPSLSPCGSCAEGLVASEADTAELTSSSEKATGSSLHF